MRDNTNPTGAWEFNGEVAACFANMLERSIPDYRSMRALVYNAGERFVKPDTLIVDVGCSTGLAVEPFVTKHRDENDFLLIDNAPAMAKRRSLENVLSPLEPEWNEAMLKEAGFRRVQMFWRCLNFCGWIAVK